MQRRQILQWMAASTLAPAVPTWSQVTQPSAHSELLLDRGRWNPAAHARIEAVLRDRGTRSAGYKASQPPYAVFDWDNTSIVNDTQEALLLFQIESFSFQIAPEDFAALLRTGVPPGSFAAPYLDIAGKAIPLDAITLDLADDYALLTALPGGVDEKRAARERSPHFAAFRARLLFLYAALDETYGSGVAYPWVLYLLSGHTPQQISELAEASNDFGLGDALRDEVFTVPAERAARSGIVSVKHRRGLRTTPEIASAMHALEANGFDVYVVSASLEHVVAVFATLPRYGYNIKRERVFGLRLEEAGGKLLPRYRSGWPLVWGPGKSQLIRREFVSKYGYGPTLVFGDSDGDYDMLRDFPATEAGLIVNRLKSGKIGSLCKLAAAQHGRPDARYLLQGRNETIGAWQPSESSRALGASEDQLLA